MRSIIMVSDMNCANCAEKIERILESSNLQFEIRLDRKIVIIEGNNDQVRSAKDLIQHAGFQVL